MRVLHLGEGIVNYRVPGPSQLLDGRLFRSLTTLSLFDNYLSSGRPSWTNWFTPMNLPQLCRLTIGTMGASSTARTDHDFIQALELVAPRIRDLTITQGRPIAMFTSNFPWSAFSTIRRLALYLQVGDPLALIEVALAELPSRALSHLLIGYVRSPSRRRAQVSDVWVKEILPKLMQALEARSGVDSLQALEVLMLHYGREAAQLVTRKTLHPLGLIMKARGGTLDRRVGWGEPTEMLEWERYVDVW